MILTQRLIKESIATDNYFYKILYNQPVLSGYPSDLFEDDIGYDTYLEYDPYKDLARLKEYFVFSVENKYMPEGTWRNYLQNIYTSAIRKKIKNRQKGEIPVFVSELGET